MKLTDLIPTHNYLNSFITPATSPIILRPTSPVILTTWLIQNEELPETASIMSVSLSDCFSDLLCCEESDEIFSGNEPSEYSFDIDYRQLDDDFIAEWIAELIEHETYYVPGLNYITRFQSKSLDASARAESIAWILKVQRCYGFQPLTAYLSVNYLDRFLYSCPLPPRTITRMEIVVLSTLDWRLRSITPFNYMSFFAYKVDPSTIYNAFLISRATQIILSHIQETRFLEYMPSCIAAATIICAAHDLPIFSCVTPQYAAESWCYGLHKEQVMSCLQFIQQIVKNERPKKETPAKVLPQLRVMSRLNGVSNGSESSSFSSSLSSSSSFKRRRLDNTFWTDDEKETTSE